MPCNFNLRELAADVARGIREAGGTPMEFNTIAISDGITMGTEGMKTSLVSREVIADSIELVARGHMFDGIVALVACDKTIPGARDGVAAAECSWCDSLWRDILPGRHKGKDITMQDVFEAVGANAAGRMSDRGTTGDRKCRLPGARSLRRPIHREHHGDRDGDYRAFADGGECAFHRWTRRKHDAARLCGRIILDAVQEQLAPAGHCDAGGNRKRHRECRGIGRFDKRGAPSYWPWRARRAFR